MKLFLLNVSLCILLVAGDDPRKFKPYEILGVQRSSSTQEIKKAFKRLVKELHPDKNKSPDANDRFVELVRAHDLLSDPERKLNYDNYGITEESPNFKQKHDYAQYNRFGDPFDHLRDLFGDGFGKFRTGREQNIFHKQVIPMWSKLVEELEPIGFVLATVHTEHERELARDSHI